MAKRGHLDKPWRAFMYPYGRKRQFSPRGWALRDKVLVFGELSAVAGAVGAIPIELAEWPHAPWLIIAATIIGTCALLWYALDLISVGEMPLTNRSAHTIRQVINAVEMEKQGAVFEWEAIQPDSGIPTDLSGWAGLRPDVKAVMERHGVPLQVALAMLRDQGGA